MRVRTLLIALVGCMTVGVAVAPAQTVTDEVAASLATAFCPPALVTDDTRQGYPDEALGNPLQQMESHRLDGCGWSGYMGYKEIHLPNDAKTYVLLFWRDDSWSDVCWRLLGSADGKTFQLVQDSNAYYTFDAGEAVWVALADLDGDGVPEVLFQGGNCSDVLGMYVFAWRGGQLVLISPRDDTVTSHSFAGVPFVVGQIHSQMNRIVLQDLDGDGKAEIVACPDLMNKVFGTNSDGSPEVGPAPFSPTRVFKLDSTGFYKLSQQIPADQPFPIAVPGIAVIHPGTIPLSQIANAKGGGDLRVFVSHPAGTTYTVDGFDTASFAFDPTKTPLTFTKRWDNHQYPDLSKGNREWMGVPVRQTARASQGVWNVDPSDPTYPSPDPTMEFHFLGPYLELRIAKSAVYPFLLERANADFAKDPTKTSTFIEVPISGKMKGGKLAAIGAIVCVTKTGSGK
jgi:hypothetical protein